MKTAGFNNRLIEAYLEMLRNLDSSAKLELISKLANSLKPDPKKQKDLFRQSFGSWEESENVHQLLTDIRNSRNFSREIENL